mmetsp:Transcript_32350/g.74311  ORF Transcript_32350/g.74311 Transcript_32350/m.74311 type:complete len:351 (+) Transcript_32350:38-1090(+)
MSINIKKVVVFGATGAIGTSLIEILSEKEPSWKIAAISRSEPTSSKHASIANLPNVEMVQGDVEDLKSAQQVTEGADMVYACIGLAKYERRHWAQHWPIVVENLLQVTSYQRPLVFCDNLYAYGPTTNITPNTETLEPGVQSKPAIRALIRQKLEERMEQSPGSLGVVGGADFFGPGVDDEKSFLNGVVIRNMVQGKKPMALGSSNAIHDFCYVRDFSNALYVVSKRPAAMGRFWICPHSIHDKTLAEIAILIAKKCPGGGASSSFSVWPYWMVVVLGLFTTTLGELQEMMPYWQNHYSVDDTEFVKEFGIEATPCEEALEKTVDYYQQVEKKELEKKLAAGAGASCTPC